MGELSIANAKALSVAVWVSGLMRPCGRLFLPCFVTIGAMRIFFLVLLVVEVSTTMMGGVWAMVAPMDFVPNMTGLVPGAS